VKLAGQSHLERTFARLEAQQHTEDKEEAERKRRMAYFRQLLAVDKQEDSDDLDDSDEEEEEEAAAERAAVDENPEGKPGAPMDGNASATKDNEDGRRDAKTVDDAMDAAPMDDVPTPANGDHNEGEEGDDGEGEAGAYTRPLLSST